MQHALRAQVHVYAVALGGVPPHAQLLWSCALVDLQPGLDCVDGVYGRLGQGACQRSRRDMACLPLSLGKLPRHKSSSLLAEEQVLTASDANSLGGCAKKEAPGSVQWALAWRCGACTRCTTVASMPCCSWTSIRAGSCSSQRPAPSKGLSDSETC